MNSDELLKSRLDDLSRRAYERGYTVYSDFLNLEEASALQSINLQSRYELFGGYDGAERCVAAFGEDIDHDNYPIVCVEIKPLNRKFSDKLTHRDFLGALMNLGINRATLGDIVQDENTAYLFCLDSMSDYIIENLSRVKHTTVICGVIEELPDCAKKEPVDKEVIVTSLRADAVISAVYHFSRSQAKSIFAEDRVFVNHRQLQSASQTLKDGDAVSVRGHGKFMLRETLRTTKKDRLVIRIGLYV